MRLANLADLPLVRRWALPSLGLATLVALGIALFEGPQPALAGTPAVSPAAPSKAALDALTPAQRMAVEQVVRQYILDHPEIIPQAITRLQNREVGQLLDTNRAEIEKPYASAWAGAADGDVTLVEFYDYACPYCRAAKADVERLLREDKRLKVVYRDFPVITEASREAALASLSAAQQGRHGAFYDRMFDMEGRVTHEKVVAAVRAAGLNEMRTAQDLGSKAGAAQLDRNVELGQALGLSGTPAYVIGSRILVGAVGYGELKAAIAEARAGRR